MPTRKTFLKQASMALAGSCIPFSKLFAEGLKPPHATALDNYHPADCAFNLTTHHKYTYSEDPLTKLPTADSDIDVLYGYYSEGGTATNPYCNDVVYAAEGDGMYDPSCEVAVLTNGCNPYDYDPANSPTYEGKNPFRYKAYYLKTTKHNYATTLPVYIFFHAGGFQECTGYEGEQLKQICTELAQNGFISITCEYRRGRILDPVTTLTSVQ